MVLGVKDGEHATARAHGAVQLGDERFDQFFLDVVKGGPEQDDIKLAAAEVHVLVEETACIEAGRAALFHGWALPVAAQGLVDQVRHPDAVAHVGEVVDIGGRGRAYVENAQAGLGMQMLF